MASYTGSGGGSGNKEGGFHLERDLKNDIRKKAIQRRLASKSLPTPPMKPLIKRDPKDKSIHHGDRYWNI